MKLIKKEQEEMSELYHQGLDKFLENMDFDATDWLDEKGALRLKKLQNKSFREVK